MVYQDFKALGGGIEGAAVVVVVKLSPAGSVLS
jgi:hypothetical protein